MTPTNARRLVITCIALTGVIAVVRDISRGDAPDVPALVIGSFLTAMVLGFAADFVPEFAAMFAVLILLGMVFANGITPWEAVTKRLGRYSSQPKGTIA